jgi:hypothetical protein
MQVELTAAAVSLSLKLPLLEQTAAGERRRLSETGQSKYFHNEMFCTCAQSQLLIIFPLDSTVAYLNVISL